jgi:hypothetical protein
MRWLVALAVSSGLFSLTAGCAPAASLTTFPLSAGSDGGVQCELVNVGEAPIDVTVLPVRVAPSDGPVFDPVFCPNVAPNSRCVVKIKLGMPIDLYCKFTFGGSKTAVRALIETVTASGTTTAALPAN